MLVTRTEKKKKAPMAFLGICQEKRSFQETRNEQKSCGGRVGLDELWE